MKPFSQLDFKPVSLQSLYCVFVLITIMFALATFILMAELLPSCDDIATRITIVVKSFVRYFYLRLAVIIANKLGRGKDSTIRLTKGSETVTICIAISSGQMNINTR